MNNYTPMHVANTSTINGMFDLCGRCWTSQRLNFLSFLEQKLGVTQPNNVTWLDQTVYFDLNKHSLTRPTSPSQLNQQYILNWPISTDRLEQAKDFDFTK